MIPFLVKVNLYTQSFDLIPTSTSLSVIFSPSLKINFQSKKQKTLDEEQWTDILINKTIFWFKAFSFYLKENFLTYQVFFYSKEEW